MPKWIGNGKRHGVTEFLEGDVFADFIRVTYTQQLLFEPADVRVVLDDTDKGGPKRPAKRWWRWYARRSCITPMHSESLRRRAAEGRGGIKGYAACRLLPALIAASACGADWDAPEAAEARETTRILGISWEFVSWETTLSHVLRWGTLGYYRPSESHVQTLYHVKGVAR